MKIQLMSALLIGSLGACASMVKKPQINKVAKVAVLSVYANEQVPELNGRGVVRDWDASFRTQVADDALLVVETGLKMMGWNVVSGRQVVQSKEYQEAFAVKTDNAAVQSFANALLQARRDSFFAPSGMHPVQIKSERGNTSKCWGNGCPPDPKERLAAFAKQLGVDAVVVAELDYCYEGGIAFAGTGEAKMTAGMAIRAVSKEGDMLIDMPVQQRCNASNKGVSESGMGMINGNLMFITASKPKMQRMFSEATQQSVQNAVAQIKEAMK